jgi:hypothetical protein
MIKNYNSFLLEGLILQLYSVMEGHIYGSTDFIMKFKKISNIKGKTGEIAEEILNLIEKEKYIKDDKIKQNYFGLSDKDDMLSFVQKGKISSDWNSEDDPGLPYTLNRGDVKIGKIVKYLLKFTKVKYNDKELEEFVNHFKATNSNSKLKFELVNGDDIEKYYKAKTYYNLSGSLGGSCMADSENLFEVYTRNTSKVSLLVLLDNDDKVHGRSLVWKLSDSPCEAKYFMDRVYTNRDSDVIKFKMYAEEKGWMLKKKMNSYIEDNVCFSYKGSVILGEIKVELEEGDLEKYPFLDTLSFLDEKKKNLSNLSGINTYFLHSLSGNCKKCSGCNGSGIECRDCYGSNEVECYYCEGIGEIDDVICVNCDGSGIIKCEHPYGTLCSDCSSGHKTLIENGIETNINKNISTT